MDSISIFKNLEYTQKRKPYPLKFNDVMYYFFDIVKRKTDAEKYGGKCYFTKEEMIEHLKNKNKI